MRLVKALRSGDAAGARQIMKDHMETAQDLMQGQEAEMLRRFISE